MSGLLEDERTLVVGASRGIGRAVAETFAREGADVAVAARSVDPLESLSDELPGRSLAVTCDLRETESVDRAVDRAVDEFGGLDAVYNSAGALVRGPLAEASDEDLELVVDVNLLGAMRLSRAALPSLVDSGGTLLHVSSMLGEQGAERLPAYCASKGGLNNLIRQLAVEYGPDGVNVVGVAPGTTATELNAAVRERDPEWVEKRRQGVPLGRLGTTADVAELSAFLASDRAAYVTGEIVTVDGGVTA
jgi:NAD(P)-dependent dehydrogenase (short-subunit alcohol dehydrogenase family)